MGEQIDPVSRLAKAGIELPVSLELLANYVSATRNSLLVHTSGQLPLRAGQLLHRVVRVSGSACLPGRARPAGGGVVLPPGWH